jgi:hypothetical protein
MNIVVAPRLLIKTASQPRNTLALAGGPVQIRELCPNETIGFGLAAAGAARWYLAELGIGATAPSTADIWDMAHQAAQQHNAYVEPDIGVQWDYRNRVTATLGAAPGDLCQYNDQSGDFPKGQGFAWHLKLSQLKAARDQVAANPAKVRIGILDTGFDPNHQARPEKLLLDLQRNFVDDGRPIDDASDPYERGPFKNPGHGTGTIGLLAGQELRNMAQPRAEWRLPWRRATRGDSSRSHRHRSCAAVLQRLCQRLGLPDRPKGQQRRSRGCAVKPAMRLRTVMCLSNPTFIGKRWRGRSSGAS